MSKKPTEKLTIATVNGPFEATCAARSGGLAVTAFVITRGGGKQEESPGEWVITHIGTGLSGFIQPTLQAEAIKALEKIVAASPLGFWESTPKGELRFGNKTYPKKRQSAGWTRWLTQGGALVREHLKDYR